MPDSARSLARSMLTGPAAGTVGPHASDISVALLRRLVGGIAARRVVDLAAGPIGTDHLEAGLDRRPLGDEREPETLPALLGVAGTDADVVIGARLTACLLYTSPSPRDRTRSRMPSSA